MSNAERTDRPAKTVGLSPWFESVLHRSFRILDAFGNFRQKRHWWTVVGEVIFSGGLAHYLWLGLVRPLAIQHGFERWEAASSIVADGLANGLLGLIVYLFVSIVTQMAAVARRGMAARDIGLAWLSDRHDIYDLLEYYLKRHPETDEIRVICMSGKGLFGCEEDTQNKPLRRWAESGLLDVIMPFSDKHHPTIHERFRRYSDKTKRETYKNDIGELVKEVEAGKKTLGKTGDGDNEVTEHRVLCLWRVIILQNYCLVQSYFPNAEGTTIEDAPVVVYQNTGPHSYYQTYVEMFKLLKKHSKRGS